MMNGLCNVEDKIQTLVGLRIWPSAYLHRLPNSLSLPFSSSMAPPTQDSISPTHRVVRGLFFPFNLAGIGFVWLNPVNSVSCQWFKRRQPHRHGVSVGSTKPCGGKVITFSSNPKLHIIKGRLVLM